MPEFIDFITACRLTGIICMLDVCYSFAHVPVDWVCSPKSFFCFEIKDREFLTD